ncbi:MAG TPA: glycosyltransferase family 9 protein [Candidatus Limnocylindrales bacterium]|nr:glycosyltransferase family 9 protein [Candidatus Limnocylindrales bacterium]
MMRIALIRALALGDMLCAVPTFRALRARFPDAHIALIGLPWAQELVRRFPAYLDELIEFPGFPGIPEVPVDPRRTTAFLAAMQERRFDLVVQLQGNGLVINEFAALLAARRLAGFVPHGIAGGAPHGTPRDDPADVWVPYPATGHEIDRLLTLTTALEAAGDDHLEFPVMAADRDDAEHLLTAAGIAGRPFAVIHAGGSRPDRRWPAQRFAEVADTLASDGLGILLTGTVGEADVTAAVARTMHAGAADLAGRTSLGALAGLVEAAHIVVTNDTGVSHLAAAIGSDSVAVFSASDPARWAPRGAGRHVIVGTGVPDGEVGRVDVPVADVVDAAQRLLSDRTVRGTASGMSRSRA